MLLNNSFAATSKHIETSLPLINPDFFIAVTTKSRAWLLLLIMGAKPPSSPTEVDNPLAFINFDKLNEIGINSVEIYTGPFAEVIQDGKKHEIHNAQNKISKIVESAKLNNLKVNAGHDLNLNNLPYLKECGDIDEVSIGHAIIVDSLKYGFKDTINMYIEEIKK